MSSTHKLNSGHEIPMLALGTWQAAPGEVKMAIFQALKAGYRHLDCAAIYGNEKEVGEALKEAIEQKVIKREDVFITSKLWNNSHHPDDVEKTFEKTRSDLGLEYLDLYLIHWPYAFKRGEDMFPTNENEEVLYDFDISPTETWLAMEKLVEKGLVRSIGVSNFNSLQIKDILEKGQIKPACNQVECHPFFQQNRLLEFCKEHNILLTAYSPFGSPGRAWAKADEESPLKNPLIAELAKSYNKSSAQIVLRWQIQRGVLVMPKSTNEKRIAENGNVFDFTLKEDDMKKISTLDRKDGRRIVPINKEGVARDAMHPHYSFNAEF